MARTAITFNGVDFQDSNVMIRDLHHESADHREVNIQRLGRDGAKVVDSKFGVKGIKLVGVIKDTNKANMEARIDDLKRDVLGVIDKDLDIAYSSGTRRYVCTCDRLIFNREHYTIDALPFEAHFVVGKPYGKDLDTTTLEYSPITTAERDSGEFGGSARPLPKIRIDVTAAAGVTALEFQNNTTGDTITINEDLVASDVLIIDCDELSVTLNGEEVDYEGIFPIFNAGWNDFYLWVTGTTYNLSLKLIYYKLWI